MARGQADAILIEAQGRAEALDTIGAVISENRDLLTYRYIEKLPENIRVMLVPTDAPLILPMESMMQETDTLTPTLPLTETLEEEVLSVGQP
jgi:regulator of protease activity HflC (stomatin/prohibitin superfamily)